MIPVTKETMMVLLKKKIYDFVIVGAGLSGSVIANKLAEFGYDVLILERRNHIGGNCYTEDIHNNGIQVHKYGAHILRTGNEEIYDYVNSFTDFSDYKHKVIANYNNELFSFPINLMTLQQVFGRSFTPEEATEFFKKYTDSISDVEMKTKNDIESFCISNIGNRLYEIFFKHYTEKQWNKKCSELPSSIIKRIPIRMNFNDSYFDDSKIYEVMPDKGYTNMFENMLCNNHIDVIFNFDYNENREIFKNQNIIYTGALDELYDDSEKLEWRGVKFNHEHKCINDFQGVSVMNFVSPNTLHTRIIEHKHFYQNNENKTSTSISYEYPITPEKSDDKYYPVLTDNNLKIVDKLTKRAKKDNIILCGRLAEYKYLDMDVAIENALSKINDILILY